MNVLVTGGCGYIGTVLVRKLIEADHKVIVLDKGFFPSGMAYCRSEFPQVPLMHVDVLNIEWNHLCDIDAVCHLAGMSNDPTANYNPEANWRMNKDATHHIAELAAMIGIERFTYAGSASVYGMSSGLNIKEDDAVSPNGHYSESKYAGEAAIWDVVTKYNTLKPTIFRQGTVMGWSPRHRSDLVVNAMVRSALLYGKIVVNGGGESIRPLLHVEDVAEAHCRALSLPLEDVGNQTFNIAHKRSAEYALHDGYTISCLALWIKDILDRLGYNADVVGNWDAREGRSYDINCDKLHDAFGWMPTRGVTAAVEGIVEQYEIHGLDLESPEHKNIDWMKALDYGSSLVSRVGSVFS